MGIFLIIVIIVIACWPWISRWLRSFLARRAEDYLRKATGMPPRPGSREEKRQQRASSRQTYSSNADNFSDSTYSRRTRQRRRTRNGYKEPIIPPEYAEDVEFVETKSFSETTIGGSDRQTRQFHESQVSDVEWVEIKNKR